MIEKATKDNLERLKKSLDKRGLSKEVKSVILNKINLLEGKKKINK